MKPIGQKTSRKSKSMLVGFSLAAGSVFGYGGYIRPAFAAATCEVTGSDNASVVSSLKSCLTTVDANGVISFAAGIETITVSANDPFIINKSLTISGNSTTAGVVSPTFDGQGASQLFRVVAPATNVEFNGLGFENGSGANGGAIYNASSSLEIRNSSFVSNSATSYGGAIWGGDGTDLNISGSSSFTGNYAYRTGGAVYLRDDTILDVQDGTFHANSSIGGGGAIFTRNNSTVSILRSDFTENTSSFGGAVYVISSQQAQSVAIRDSFFARNQSDDGGALVVYDTANFSVDGSTFANNSANDKGGAMYLYQTNSTITNSTFYKNGAGNGSAIYFGYKSLDINFSTVYKNYDTNGSGDAAIYGYSGAIAVTNSIIAGTKNLADDTAAADVDSSSFDIAADGLFNISGQQDVGLVPVLNGSVFSHLIPVTGSVASLAADPSVVFTPGTAIELDQVGTLRVQGQANIGAINSIQESAAVDSPAFSAPAPTTLPILTLNSTGPFAPGETVFARVSNAATASRITIGDKDAQVVEFENGILSFLVPDIDTGEYSITGVFDAGTLTFDVGLTVSSAVSATNNELAVWTKKISDTEVKVYAKNPIGAGKIQFMVNGQEIAWVRAESENDPKLIRPTDSYYLVRTVELNASKSAIEIYVDGERTWRAVYTAKG